MYQSEKQYLQEYLNAYEKEQSPILRKEFLQQESYTLRNFSDEEIQILIDLEDNPCSRQETQVTRESIKKSFDHIFRVFYRDFFQNYSCMKKE